MPITVIYRPNGPLPYDPYFRTGNCYTYALGHKPLGFVRPGQLKSTFSGITPSKLLNINGLNQLLKKDSLIRIRHHHGNKDQVLACVVWPDEDYHFFRMHPDGTWSHMLPGHRPQLTDNSDNRIECPTQSDNGPYTEFVGFYRIPRTGLRYAV